MTASRDEGSKPKDAPRDQPKDPAAGKAAAPGAQAGKPGTPADTGPSAPAAPSGGPKPGVPNAAPGASAAKPPAPGPSATVQPPPKPAEPAKPGTDKPAPAGAPLKPAATGSSAVPPVSPSKDAKDTAPKPSEPLKGGTTGSGAVKPEAAAAASAFGKTETKPEPKPDAKSDTRTDTKPGAGPQASRAGAKDTAGDGPILDLKAKRLPDPSQAKPTGGETTAAAADGGARGAGFGSIAASGLIGGVIGAGLLFALTQSGVLAPDTARLDALDQKMGALATRDALGALDKRVAANEQGLKPLADTVRTATERADAALKKAEAAPSAAAPGSEQNAAPAVPSDLAARLDALDQRVSALQEEPGRDQSANSAVSAPPVEGQNFDALRRDIDERAKADQELAARLDQIQQSVDSRIKAAADAAQAAAEAGRQAAEAGRTQAAEAAKGVDRRLQEQGERLAALDKAVDGSAKSATVEAALRIVAADRIATALAAGQPYSDALTSLRATKAGDAGVLGPLEPFAESGAPTAASLAAGFRPIHDKVLAAQRAAKARKVAETGSVTDRLQNMASSIIQVRRSGEAGASGDAAADAGDDAVGKVQTALDNGRIREAAQAFAALPEDVRAQAGEFGTKLKARAEADAAAQALQAEAFKSLSAGR